MRRVFSREAGTVVVATCLAALLAPPASAQDDSVPWQVVEFEVLDAKFPALTISRWSRVDDEPELVYGDIRRLVHHIVSVDGEYRERWKSFPLEGDVKEIFVEDLNRDGEPEIIAYTARGLVYIWDTKDNYKLIWESVNEGVTEIQAMTVADVDSDPQLELVVCINNRVVYYDGVDLIREKEGRDEINPSFMMVADVDGDFVDEIVTDDGFVLSSKTLVLEWAAERFGYPWYLIDIDGDDVLELVGEIRGALKIWDIQDRREVW